MQHSIFEIQPLNILHLLTYVLTVNSVCSMKWFVIVIMIGMRLVFSREQSLYYPSSCIEMLGKIVENLREVITVTEILIC